MTAIVVDTDRLRWKATLLEVFLGSIRRAQREISEATEMGSGYDGQLRRQVMAIAGDDESLVRVLASDLEELISRLRQITAAFEAADAIGVSDPALGSQFTQLIDGGLLLSSLPSVYRYGDPLLELEERLWLTHDPEARALLLGGGANGYLRAFARSPLFPSSGSEADYWRALQVFLYVSGAVEAQPPLPTWRAAASASGRELDAYVAVATGVREQHVDAWFRAAETHAMGLDTAIGEIVDMTHAGETIEQHFGFSMAGNWSEGDQDDIVEAVLMVSHAMASSTPGADSAGETFRGVFDGIEYTLETGGAERTWYCTGGGAGMACQPGARDRISPQTIAHELGHSFNARLANHLDGQIEDLAISDIERAELVEMARDLRPYSQLNSEEIVAEIDGEIVHVAGPPPGGGYQRTDLGYATLGTPWQQHSLRWGGGDPTGNTANEDYADMFLGWAYDGFTDDPAGDARYGWMENHMPAWIEQASQPINLEWLADPAP
jgi:hypothetical protein